MKLEFVPDVDALPRAVNPLHLAVATLVDGQWQLLPTRLTSGGVIESSTTHFSTFALVETCHTIGTGTDFPLVGCGNVNPTVTTDSPVTLDVTGAPLSIELRFAPAATPSNVTVQVTGLRPSWTYWIIAGGSTTQSAIPTDASGALSYVQQVDGNRRMAILSAMHGSIALTAATCVPPLGEFDTTTNTCSLTADILEPPVYLRTNNITLDCQDPHTGARHRIGDAAVRYSDGIVVESVHSAFLPPENVTVRNCDVVNVDRGISVGASKNVLLRNVTVRTEPGTSYHGTGTGIGLGGENSRVEFAEVSGTLVGVAITGTGLIARDLKLTTRGVALGVGNSDGVLVQDVSVTGSIFAAPPIGPGPTVMQPFVVGAINSKNTTFRRVHSTDDAHDFSSVFGALFGSAVRVESADLRGGHLGVWFDAPAADGGIQELSDATIAGNDAGVSLVGGSKLVFQNNIFGNGDLQVASDVPVELSDTRIDAGTYQRGNYWGRGCPGPLFIAGEDSNSSAVTDSYPFGSASAWSSGGTPGCGQQPLAKPVFLAPSNGAFIALSRPLFIGVTTPGATVDVAEGSSIIATAVADANGRFEATPAAALTEGVHTVTATAVLSGVPSPSSDAVTFTVDTIAPSAPIVLSPSSGAALFDGSPSIVGLAEAGAFVSITRATATLASGTATSTGVYSLRLTGLADGLHTLAVKATDRAGNASAPTSLAFSVASTAVGTAGRLRITDATDFPDAFEPFAGESNNLGVTGSFEPPTQNSNVTYVVRLDRRVYAQASGALVRSLSSTSASLTAAHGTLPLSASIAWDGHDSTGSLVPAGSYLSVVDISVVKLSGGSSSACVATIAGGGCVIDSTSLTVIAEVVSSPVLLRPPAANAASSLVATAATIVPTTGALVIPEAAFLAALSGRHAVASDDAKRTAVRISGAMNDPDALGVVADIQLSATPMRFSGEVFIVARSAETSGGGRFVESGNTYVAAVNLTGFANWVGTNPGIAASGVGGPPASANCCDPANTCIPQSGGSGPCGSTGMCPSADTLVAGMGSYGDTELQIFGDSTAGFTLPNTYECKVSLFPSCTQASPYCDDTTNPNASMTPQSGSDQCGNSGGAPVPDICLFALEASTLPQECGGYCKSCGEQTWSVGGVHPSCQVMQPVPGSNICDSRTAAQQWLANVNALLNLKQSDCAGARGSLNPQCCGANCACLAAGSITTSSDQIVSLETCTACNADDQCVSWTSSGGTVDLLAVGVCKDKDDNNCEMPRDENECDAKCVGEGIANFFKAVGEGLSAIGGFIGDLLSSIFQAVSNALTSSNSSVPGGGKGPPGLNGIFGPGSPNPTTPNNLNVTVTPGGDGKGGGSKKVTEDPKKKGEGEPVSLGAGSLELSHVDMSFDGIARPLRFERAYASQSNSRGPIGSNWTHNWDVWLEFLREGTTPAWAPTYCATPGRNPFCVMVHGGVGRTQLFLLDYSTGLYLPYAGSTDTLARARDGKWALRTSDGHTLAFDESGFLEQDRDRFGVGFTVTTEPTPLGELFASACANEVPTDRTTLEWRRCAVLGFLVGAGPEPTYPSAAWQVTSADFLQPKDVRARDRINYAIAYLMHHVTSGVRGAGAVDGGRRRRVTSVTDDLGRTLSFSYAKAPGSGTAFDFSAPKTELLTTVAGPAGVTVSMSYGRPSGYPIELHEAFLVSTSRADNPTSADVVAAPARSLSYDYNWPSGRAPSYGPFVTSVENAYRAYFATFVGCLSNITVSVCGQMKHGGAHLTPGDPSELAKAEARAYVSAVADNILSFRQSGVLQLETRFEVNPFDLNFDRALAQRYGDKSVSQGSVTLPPDPAGANWESSMPRMGFQYSEAMPDATGADVTDSFLPEVLRRRFVLENVPAGAELPEPRIVIGKAPVPEKLKREFPGEPPLCDGSKMKELRRSLPGYVPTYAYYNAPAVSLTGQISRSRLSCAALSNALTVDPNSNDLLSELKPIESTPDEGDHTIVRVTGSRQRISADVNRICSWTRVVDRDGDAKYVGLNFRGQALVEAVERRNAPGSFTVKEQLFTADGAVLQDRRPTQDSVAWSPAAGHTVYSFDDATPTGLSGWNGWRPAFWARRFNALEVIEYPAGGWAADAEEQETLTVRASTAHFQRYSYEPLFNQIQRLEVGTIEQGGAERVDSVTDYLYDFQELTIDSASIATSSVTPFLHSLEAWGYRWLKSSDGSLNVAQIQQWQLPVSFFGKDLNGDGALGFPSDTVSGTVAGAPVALTQRKSKSSPNGLVTIYQWARHGLPAAIIGPSLVRNGVVAAPGGRMTVFEYYDRAPSAYTRTSKPTDSDLSPVTPGLLGRIKSLRLRASYDAAEGPPEGACPYLKGAYQWLLPASCTSDISTQLTALGLPPEAVAAIAGAGGSSQTNSWTAASFAYSATGFTKTAWLDTGTIAVLRDTDGRATKVTDVRGTNTSIAYSSLGHPEREVATAANGTTVGVTYRQFDPEGREVYRCRALKPSGCEPFGTKNPTDGLLELNEYSAEGALNKTTSATGLVTSFARDEYKRAVRTTAADGTASRTIERDFTTDGDVKAVRQGVSASRPDGVLGERFAYDGFRRLITRSGPRGYAWQFAWSGRGNLIRERRADAPYGLTTAYPGSTLPQPTNTGAADWENTYLFDEFGRGVGVVENQRGRTESTLTAAGEVASVRRTGFAPSFTTFDSRGTPVWRRDADGTVTVTTFSPSPHVATETVLRRGSGQAVTLSRVMTLDPAGLVKTQKEVAGGHTRTTSFTLGAAGFVDAEIGVEGFSTSYTRNLLGWPESVKRQRLASDPNSFEKTDFGYQKTSAPKTVTDPSGQVTTIDRDGFGMVTKRTVQGLGSISFTYDELGRLGTQTSTTAALRFAYDSHGDLTAIKDEGTGKTLATRGWDSLGRLTTSSYANAALGTPVAVSTTLSYDTLGRLNSDFNELTGLNGLGTAASWTLTGTNQWQRSVSSPSRAVTEMFDAAGRLVSKSSAGTQFAQFDWLGPQLIGTSQSQGATSPFRRRDTLDNWGAPILTAYSGLDLTAAGLPQDASEGATYCGGTWDASRCGSPVYREYLVRDVVGRAVSVQRQFAPALDTSASARASRWSGFTYDPLGRLANAYEHDGVAGAADTSTLNQFTVTAAQVDAVASTANATKWAYARETTVGSPTSIANADTGAVRWQTTSARASAYQLTGVSVDGQSRLVEHDTDGRVKKYGGMKYVFDAFGRLAEVHSGSVTVEAFAYDGIGRLAAHYRNGQLASAFVYDGLQMVEARTATAALWTAEWAPGLDRLLELNDIQGAGGRQLAILDSHDNVVGAWSGSQRALLGSAEYSSEGRVTARSASGQVTCREEGSGGVCPIAGGIPFGYAGAWRAPESGLVYLRSRWYSPELGQFISPDPLGAVDSFNLYAYVGFDPINNRDPLGLQVQIGGPCGSQSSSPQCPQAINALREGGFQVTQPYYLSGSGQALGAVTGGGAGATGAAGALSGGSGWLMVGGSIGTGALVGTGAYVLRNSGSGQTASGPQDRFVLQALEQNQEFYFPPQTTPSPMRDPLTNLPPMFVPTPDGEKAFFPGTLGTIAFIWDPPDENATPLSARQGGAYVLRDPVTKKVMRTGRTNDYDRREREHARDPDLKGFVMERVFPTNNYAEQRGLEELLHNKYMPPFDFEVPISERNKNKDLYREAARRYLEQRGKSFAIPPLK